MKKAAGVKVKRRKDYVSLSQLVAIIDDVTSVQMLIRDTMHELHGKRIAKIKLDGVGNAKRGTDALNLFWTAVRSAITRPNCDKEYLPEGVMAKEVDYRLSPPLEDAAAPIKRTPRRA